MTSITAVILKRLGLYYDRGGVGGGELLLISHQDVLNILKAKKIILLEIAEVDRVSILCRKQQFWT